MRLFIGVGLPDKTKNELFRYVSDIKGLNGRFTDKNNYHITLAFLGEVSPKKCAAAKNIVAQKICIEINKTVVINKAGYFGKADKAVFWTGVSDKNGFLPLAEIIRKRLNENFIEFDGKKFAPHITLTRNADVSKISFDDIKPYIKFDIDNITLFESRNVDGKLKYIPLIKQKI